MLALGDCSKSAGYNFKRVTFGCATILDHKYFYEYNFNLKANGNFNLIEIS